MLGAGIGQWAVPIEETIGRSDFREETWCGIDGYLERQPEMPASNDGCAAICFYSRSLNQQCCYGQKPIMFSQVGEA
jgi:hypothetical protein